MTSFCYRARTAAWPLLAEALFSITCMAGLQGTAAANRIVDPGFESATAGVYSGSIGDGWNVIQGHIDILNNSGGPGTSHSGQQFADLDYAFAVNELSQTFTTVGGATYAVSFWLSDDVGGNPLSVAFGSTSLFNAATPDLGSGNYELLTFNVVANSPSTSLTFTSQFTRTIGGVGAVIDDVSVTQITPEPSTLPMMIVAFGLLGLGIHRGRQSHRILPPTDLARR